MVLVVWSLAELINVVETITSMCMEAEAATQYTKVYLTYVRRCIYIYIYMYIPIFYLYVHMYIYIYYIFF